MFCLHAASSYVISVVKRKITIIVMERNIFNYCCIAEYCGHPGFNFIIKESKTSSTQYNPEEVLLSLMIKIIVVERKKFKNFMNLSLMLNIYIYINI